MPRRSEDVEASLPLHSPSADSQTSDTSPRSSATASSFRSRLGSFSRASPASLLKDKLFVTRKTAVRRYIFFGFLAFIIVVTLFYLSEIYSLTGRFSSKGRHLYEMSTGCNSTTAAASAPKEQLEQARFNDTKIALLIEMRPLRTLIPILLHYMATLPDDWPFLLMHSAEVKPLLTRSAAIKRYIASKKLTLDQLPAEIKLGSSGDVSEFLTRKTTWQRLPQPAEHIFFFQLDAMICSNSDQTPDDFLRFDWIGAPWPHIPHLRGGNGGLSMRRKSRLLRCLDKMQWNRGSQPEDVWFSECLNTFPDAVMPTFEEGMQFAVEGRDSPHYLGIHKPFGGVTVSAHYDFCPEATMLFLP
ncbi:hypothetical protein HDU86_005779 [Geranomyces michiganensis]|nr:hypothetical protein HDU86_005779 [Geranomyces michiganensis]